MKFLKAEEARRLAASQEHDDVTEPDNKEKGH
jgi:hypothetical protein